MSLSVPFPVQVQLIRCAKTGDANQFQQLCATNNVSAYDLEMIVDEKKNSSLHFAALGGHSAIVNYLINVRKVEPLRNMFGDMPLDLATRPGENRDPRQQEETIAILKQDMRNRAQQGGSGGNPVVSVHHVTLANRAAPSNTAAAPVTTANTSSDNTLPAEVHEVLTTYTHFSWESQPNDFVLSGLLPYIFKGNTYFTPVHILRSKRPEDDMAQRYRCRIQMNNLNGLLLSLRAVSAYLDPLSGTVRPSPPFNYPSLLKFVQDGVIPKFSQCPPLADARSSSAMTSLSQAIPIEILMRRVASGYHDGTALRYNVQTSKFEGVIPVQSVGAAVPVHIAVPHDSSSAAASPVVLVVPTANLVLQPNISYLDRNSGQVLPASIKALREWSTAANSYEQMGTLFFELERLFAQQLPIRDRTAVQPASAGHAPPSPVVAQPAPAPSAAKPSPSPPVEDYGDMSCIICLSERRQVMLIPCKHFLLCKECAQNFKKVGKQECPVCRQKATDYWEIYT